MKGGWTLFGMHVPVPTGVESMLTQVGDVPWQLEVSSAQVVPGVPPPQVWLLEQLAPVARDTIGGVHCTPTAGAHEHVLHCAFTQFSMGPPS